VDQATLYHSRTALIVGAGIGGLAAGLALRRAGWGVRIYERAAAPRELGFALALAPNAMDALQELDLADTLIAAGVAGTMFEVRHTDGRVIRRFSVQPGGAGVIALRPALYGALLNAVGSEVLVPASEAVDVATGGEGALLTLGDGSERVRSRRTRRLIALGPRIARMTTTRNPVRKLFRTTLLRLTPESILMRAAQRGGDPHRALRFDKRTGG